MSSELIKTGFVPLVDAAPLIIAREIGFDEEEGVRLQLRPEPSWSALRDRLVMGQCDVAHMLSPVPVAMALGVGGMVGRIDVLSVLSVNGNVVGVSEPIAKALQANGYGFDFADARRAGQALATVAPEQLRMGVPFPFSMHAELVYHWLGALGLPVSNKLDVRTVPPPQMAAALGRGELDAFCVGEPWGSISVENGHGALLLPGSAIWAGAPEKVLAVRASWTEEDLRRSQSVIRTIWRAQRWLAETSNLSTASDILARAEYLDTPGEIIERALTGQLIVNSSGKQRDTSTFLRFHQGAAGFPWRSQAAWIADHLATRLGLDREAARQTGRDVFRSDIYRSALAPLLTDLPGASEKVEGALSEPTAVASQRGTLLLEPDQFFDGSHFDPSVIA